MQKKIIDVRKNIMGTLSFECRFNGMRKSQEFIVYPIKEGQTADKIMIQSDTRIGYIYLEGGAVSLCKPVSSGAYFPHLMFIQAIDRLSDDELINLKLSLFQTADKNAGSSFIHTDNSNADKVLI